MDSDGKAGTSLFIAQRIYIFALIQITWSELPNYKDVVIPKTELYFRSTLLDRIDSSVETHLWRRKIVIVKRFKFDFLTRDSIKFFKKEANIFKVLKHDNIVKFFGVVVDPPSLGIVMQFGVNGDLFKLLEKKRESYTEDDDRKNTTVRKSISLLRPYAVSSIDSDEEEVDIRHSEDIVSTNSRSRSGKSNDATQTRKRGESYSRRQSIAARMMSLTGLRSPSQHFGSSHFEPLYCALQVAYGMAYLHSQNVIHRDLKSLNVLLDEEFNALISDFGESAFDNIGGKTDRKSDPSYHDEPIGTAGWAAPEALKGSVTKASDVFSFGILLWELVTWRAPAVLVPLGVLLEPPLCYVPSVLEALTQFRDAYMSDASALRTNEAPNSGVEMREQLKSSDESSVGSRPKEIRLGQSNSMRDPLTNLNTNSSRVFAASNDKTGSMGNAFSAVFSKISYAPHPGAQLSAAEIARGISPNERLLVDVSNMTIAMELMYRQGYLPPLPIGIPQELCDMMTKCWERDPANRPTFGQV
jgi:serine/threonine protein kinase